MLILIWNSVYQAKARSNVFTTLRVATRYQIFLQNLVVLLSKTEILDMRSLNFTATISPLVSN
ncbi:MAG TPA: hypothetical protein V6D09_19295 [Leptolyngbyaceae cyanobacterium]